MELGLVGRNAAIADTDCNRQQLLGLLLPAKVAPCSLQCEICAALHHSKSGLPCQQPAEVKDHLAAACRMLHKSIASVELPCVALDGGMLTQHHAGVHKSCFRDVTAVISLWLDPYTTQASRLVRAA